MDEAERLNDYAETQKAGRCALCAEVLRPNGEQAEMFDPKWADQSACFLVHGECGVAQGWEVG